jgi:reactive intermediate/imine deaminase
MASPELETTDLDRLPNNWPRLRAEIGRRTMTLEQTHTPAALIDLQRMERNIYRMQRRMQQLQVNFRPHVKTTKCPDVVAEQIKAGAKGIAVSTLKEAAEFSAAGITDILYAVGIVPSKLPQVLALRRKGCDLKVIVDNAETALSISQFGNDHAERLEVWIEIDTDGHRSGIKPDEPALLEVGKILHTGGMKLGGVLTHAGSSYELNTPETLRALAEQERSGCVRAAETLRQVGLPCPVVSVGSTPTALYAQNLSGVTEVRAGVYVFFDLVMANTGVCAAADIALSVLTTVIGHQVDKGWAIVDAGWMAMSRDRGTQKQQHDYGYGQVCQQDGTIMDDYVLSSCNQEHGILSRVGEPDHEITSHFPIGTRLRILPNHACATGAQFPEYIAVEPDGTTRKWKRFYGWDGNNETPTEIKRINPAGLSNPGGHYSHTTIANGLVYISGQLPITPDGVKLAHASFEEQAEQVLANVKIALEDAGSSIQKLVQVRVYIASIDNWPVFNALYAQWAGESRPARAVVPTGPLHFGLQVEVEAIGLI